jgi:cytochrome c oxidase assembly protein subunit 15
MLLVLLQVGLGIFSVLNSVHITLGQFGTYELFAELHQMVAILLLMSLLVNLYLLQKTN